MKKNIKKFLKRLVNRIEKLILKLTGWKWQR